MKLDGNTILITGGTGGLGLELAKELLKHNNAVIVTGRDPERLGRVGRELPQLYTVQSDVSRIEDIDSLFAHVLNDFPALNVIVNNASEMRTSSVQEEQQDLEELTSDIERNLKGPIWMVTRFLSHLTRMPSAAIVNMYSVPVLTRRPDAPIYSATTAALRSFSRSLRVQLKETTVKVFDFALPATETELCDPKSPHMVGVPVMKLSELVRQCLGGLQKDQFEIRPGQADEPQSTHFVNRLATALHDAQGLIDNRRPAEAIAPLTEAARLAPTDPAVLHQLGLACVFAQRLPEAVTWLRSAIAIMPSVARVHFELGMALAQTGDENGALASFGCATVLEPKHAEAHGRAGDILRQKRSFKEAAWRYEQAFEAAPGTAYGLLCKGRALVVQDRMSEAEAVLKEAVARAAPNERHWAVAAEFNLGDAYRQAGRLDEARASFERSIELAPWEATGYFALVMSRKITEDDRSTVKRVLDRLDAPGLSERQRMTLHFAAGKAFDDLREYASAIGHFDAANRIRRKTASFDRGEIARGVDELVSWCSRDFFLENAALGSEDETPVLVLGMPRSGTTLVERILSSHPRVGGGGELPFWSESAPAWVNAPPHELLARADGLREDYLRVLRGIAPDALRVTDKKPSNFFWVGLVHALFPKARIVHCRRNPVDTCLSIYTTQFQQTWGFASDRGDLVAYYRQYLRLMDHWRSVVPADRLLEVDYEELVVAPEVTARRLVAFCGLDWDPACLHPERNPDRIQTASAWQGRRPIYRSSAERWRNYEPWLGELRELLCSAADGGSNARTGTHLRTAPPPTSALGAFASLQKESQR